MAFEGSPSGFPFSGMMSWMFWLMLILIILSVLIKIFK